MVCAPRFIAQMKDKSQVRQSLTAILIASHSLIRPWAPWVLAIPS